MKKKKQSEEMKRFKSFFYDFYGCFSFMGFASENSPLTESFFVMYSFTMENWIQCCVSNKAINKSN